MKKIEKLNIEIKSEVKRLATEEAERIVLKKLYEAEELLHQHFDMVVKRFGDEIADAISEKYEIVKKVK